LVVLAISIVAELEDLGGFAAEGVLAELPAALGAEVEAESLEDIVADLVAFGVLQSLEEVLDFAEVIAVSLLLHHHRIKRGTDFDLHNVAEILRGIQLSFTQIASIVNHYALPKYAGHGRP
jgi:3',5'-cyclic AMP phosphodiesterase CpdA